MYQASEGSELTWIERPLSAPPCRSCMNQRRTAVHTRSGHRSGPSEINITSNPVSTAAITTLYCRPACGGSSAELLDIGCEPTTAEKLAMPVACYPGSLIGAAAIFRACAPPLVYSPGFGGHAALLCADRSTNP